MSGPTWGVVAQVKARVAAVETFVAWHLHLGAERVLVYFDDPDDPGYQRLLPLAPRVKAFRCDAAHWARLLGRRPERKTARQSANAQDAYRRTKVAWLAHIDVDEFILPLHWPGDVAPVPTVAERLAAVGPEVALQRLRPYEALIDPNGGPPRHFRAPPAAGPGRGPLLQSIYGPHAAVLVDGMLSHSVGKTLSRTGIAGLTPRIHAPRIGGEKVEAGFMRGLVLLHYHVAGMEDWLAHLEYRASHGAYSGRPASKAFFQNAGPEALAGFFQAVQVASPELLARLEEEGLLLTGAPPLQEVRARLFGAG